MGDNMNNKPSFAQPVDWVQLVDWIEKRLSPAEAEQVAAQVAVDETLQSEAAWIRTFHQIRDDLAWEAPPAEVRTQLSRRFAAFAAQSRPPGLRQRLTALLKFDSKMQPVALSMRTSSAKTERQLVYSTSYADVALTIQSPAPAKSCNLFGQILPTTAEIESSYTVQLLQEGEEKTLAVTAEGGEFLFEEMPEGEYELAIRTDRYEIVIPLQLAV